MPIRNKTRKHLHKPYQIILQTSLLSLALPRSSRIIEWPSNLLGPILSIWRFSIHTDDYSISTHFSSHENNFHWALTNVYSHTIDHLLPLLWWAFSRQDDTSRPLGVRDFNVTRYASERKEPKAVEQLPENSTLSSIGLDWLKSTLQIGSSLGQMLEERLVWESLIEASSLLNGTASTLWHPSLPW